ncbi:MAG: pantoate--beta-alanine ligase [Syntrophomonadaceae bacterium]|jgi:pantoate--beta-alanine ligase|nr:pantoate--beta-alanine ligase [Syntrophomonadaceae bacterium]
MRIFKEIQSIQNWCKEHKLQGRKIGLVPTMGYLHEGHLELVREAKRHCDIVVVSIFVNPTQFGAGEDFEVYPRDFERDTSLLERENADAVFAPTAEEMYLSDFSSWVEVTGEITTKLCGASRPGHFRGVTTVCAKLFNICLPDLAFFGQKDAQQVMVLEKMLTDLNFPLQIIRVPIVREADGLAMSSRNVCLDAEAREQALVLNRALGQAERAIKDGERDAARIKVLLREIIESSPRAEIDYAEIYDAYDLADIQQIDRKILMALAVKFGKTRLIDNRLVEV